MKKALLFASASLCLTIASNAQITKGTVLLGGGIGYSKSAYEAGTNTSTSNTLSINPTIGVAVKDNWVVGVNTAFFSSTSKPTSPTFKNEIDGFSTGLFVRRYISLSKSFYLYGEAGTYYSKSKTEQVSGTDNFINQSTNGFSINAAPGIVYAVSKRFHLEAYLNNLLSLNYSKSETEHIGLAGRSVSETKNYGFQTNFNTTAPLSIGFRFVLGK